MMTSVHVMPHEWSKFELPFRIGIWSIRRAPNFDPPADTYSKMTTSRGEGQDRNLPFE